MDAGMHGVLGAAAARLAEEASNRNRESAKGLSLVVNLALVKRESRGVAMRRDAQVSDLNTMEKGGYTITISYRERLLIPLFIPVTLEPHEICPEQNTGDVVWRKTPAGDDAAIACPADASGRVITRTCFVCFPWTCLTVYHLLSCHLQVCAFFHNRSDSAPVHPGRCRSCLLGEPNSHQVCLQELWEHSDAGKPLMHVLIKMPHMLYPHMQLFLILWNQNSKYKRFRLTSQCFFCSQRTTFPKHRWGKAWMGSLRSSHAWDSPPMKARSTVATCWLSWKSWRTHPHCTKEISWDWATLILR